MSISGRLSSYAPDRGWIQNTHGILVVLATIIMLEVFRRMGLFVPNPQLFTALAVTYAAYCGGYTGGLTGAAIGVGYAFYFFASPGEFFHYSEIARAKVIVNIITLPAIAILVSRLSHKRESNIRSQGAKALRESEAKFRGAFENAGVGVFIRSADGTRREYNHTFCEMLGYSESEIMSMRLRDIAHPDDDPASTSIRNITFENGGSKVVERRFIRKDGKVIWCNISYTKVQDANGRFLSTIAMCQDITERKEAENHLRQSQRMEAIGQLTGGVAHDFNNLLAVIMGKAELLKEEMARPSGHVDAILRTTRRGAELTQRLLAFSRNQPLHPQAVGIPQLIAELRAMLDRTLGETVEFSTWTGPDVWPAAADPGQLENALINLCINARDAMPAGGKLTIACSNVTFESSDIAANDEIQPGDYVSIDVTDTGTGMSEEILDRVFEPFFTTKDRSHGSGLGLSMVYGFAKQSGGQVTIHSKEGAGTTVKLFLPRADSSIAPIDAQEHSPPSLSKAERILVVEDDEDVRALLEKMIGNLGYSVVAAETAAEAGRTLERERIDLVLSDVILPGGTSGPEFAAQVRSTHPALKIIFMSGYPAHKMQVNQTLANDEVLLNKPFKSQDLAQALSRALNHV